MYYKTFSNNCRATCKQGPEQALEGFWYLKKLSSDCNFQVIGGAALAQG